MAKEKKKLSKSLRRFYGVGDLGFNWMTNTEAYFFQFFLTNIAQFTLPIVTMITTVTSTVDACLSWLYGAILNSTKPMKWGRYRSWLVVIPWIVPILYFFQFLKVGSGMLAVIIIIVGNITSHIAWNIPFVANAAMISVASPDPQDRIVLSAIRATWGSAGIVLFSYVGPFAISMFSVALGEKYSYAATAFLFGAIMAALYFAHFKMFKGYEDTEDELSDEGKKKADKSKTKAGDLIKTLFQNPPLLVFLIAEFTRCLSFSLIRGMTVYYFTYVVKNVPLMASYLFATTILSVIGAYINKYIAGKITSKNAYTLCIIFMFVGPLIAYFFYGNLAVVIVAMSLYQLGNGCTDSAAAALYADIIVYSEWKTGKNAAGWIMGLQNVPIKLGIVLRGIIISACLAAGSFSANMDVSAVTPQLVDAVRWGFMLIPAAICLVGTLAFTFGYRITQEKVEQYQAEIDRR